MFRMEHNAHSSFPLASPTLSRFSLTPEYDYSEPYNARRLNALLLPSQWSFSAGEITASGLLGRIFLHVICTYLQESPASYGDLDAFLSSYLGSEKANRGLRQALLHFPTTPSFYTPQRAAEYLLGDSSNVDLRHSFYSSLILIHTADQNQVFLSRDGIFTDPELRASRPYQFLNSALQHFFESQPLFQGTGKSLLDFLLEPLRAHPDSLFDQLDYIRINWASLLAPGLLQELLTSLDRLKEEFTTTGWHPGPPQDPLGFSKASYLAGMDLVRFSADQDWMPRVILLAKNVYVWLDQLSRYYQRPIHRLDHIPESEIARLAEWGITALWLIGLWERSPASQQIKQLCGNPDAVPSAYSLYDYAIADALGSEEAYQTLQGMASHYGIRLAADMVPNHMGIYSKWVIEHPDWFLSLDHSPYPGYSYNGQDLSRDPSVGIYLEDHYYDKTDAAVVFKRWDRNNNGTRFIYHGNDGTSMPWNDTAQLNFLEPDVREAVIQTILHVARKFPIIRFDAAMTLTKKHYQRLWFPQPGTGGAIPTRADFGLSLEQFDQQMPEEFWREVVDRVAQEVPDTLLLAEAFWMMEGYFVRTLGMHRVYNSAFMHMLRDEDNAKYRDLIIQTLEYDPQILKRYVNFMNNPDEETAKAQFGTDGKYFGTCLLLATLPGLPMFGHGQIEGFSEKYGMEYRRAYYNEEPDQGLIERHRREIFPLLHKRYVFAEVANFVLYDFIDLDHSLNQDVISYSNRSGAERALVVYHNKWADTSGCIHSSPLINGKSSTLLDGLGLSLNDGKYLLFRDLIDGLEYIRSLSSLAERGLEITLGAYHYHVFLDFKAVNDEDGTFQRLSEQIGDHGVPSLEFQRQGLILQGLRDLICEFTASSLGSTTTPEKSARVSRVDSQALEINETVSKFITELTRLSPTISRGHLDKIKLITSERLINLREILGKHAEIPAFFDPMVAYLSAFSCDLPTVLPQIQISVLQDTLPQDFQTYLKTASNDEGQITAELRLTLDIAGDLHDLPLTLPDLTAFCFSNSFTRSYLGVNYYDDLYWYNKESLERLLKIMFSILVSCRFAESPAARADLLVNLASMYERALNMIPASEYQVAKYQELISAS